MTGEKGQGIALDLLFAILVFLLVLNASLSLIDSGNKSVSDKGILNQLNARALQTVDMLVRTDGEPNNWELESISNVEAIGLAKRDRALDIDKVERLADPSTGWASVYGSDDYNRTKALLLIGYDYYFRISDSDDTTLYETGQPEQSNWSQQMAVTARRIANLEGGEVIVELTIYYPR